MNERVINYLREVQEKKEKAEAEYREKVIDGSGINKEYHDTCIVGEYEEYDFEKGKYFKKLPPVQLADDEWAMVKNAYEEEQKIKDVQPARKANSTGKLLQVVAVIVYIGALIAGIILGTQTKNFSFGIDFAVWISGGVLGSILLGLSEIINLLQQGVDNQRK